MPLILPAMNAAIICNGRELETYDVKQEGTSSLTAFVASEAGKQFKIAYSNNLTFCAIAVFLSVDGRQVKTACLQAGSSGEFLGPYKSECSVLPFKFQELELVDPDLEDAPVVPEMGMIELKAYRCQKLGPTDPSNRIANEGLHLGRVSERSKKAGWHHVAAGEEMLVPPRPNNVLVDYLDPLTSPPHASIKVYYRPRELLRAQGIILQMMWKGRDLQFQLTTRSVPERMRMDHRDRPEAVRRSHQSRAKNPRETRVHSEYSLFRPSWMH